MRVQHIKKSTIPSNGDSTLIQGPDWNNSHEFQGGTVYMFEAAGDGNWHVNFPDGTLVTFPSSPTQGLQEAIDYAAVNGWDLVVRGRGVNSTGSIKGVITCTVPVVIPPLQLRSLRFGGVTLNFTSAVNSYGLTFNSCNEVNFYFDGEIRYQGSVAAVRFNPTTPVSLNGNVSIVDSNFWINAITILGGTNPRCIDFDLSSNGISHNHFKFNKLFAGYIINSEAIRITDTAGSAVFTQNIVSCPHIHGARSMALRVGISSGNGLEANVFDVHINGDGSVVLANAIVMWGTHNIVRGSIRSDAPSQITTGIKLEAPAQKNHFTVTRNDAQTKITDSSTTKDSEGVYAVHKPRCSVHRNGSNQIAIVSATWTKLQLNVEAYDRASGYDSTTNFRWTPGRLGIAHVDAAWTCTVAQDTAIYKVAVYKNGVEHKTATSHASMSSKVVGVGISVDVEVTATTDFFEIWVWHDSGSNKIASGATTETYAMYRMVD